MKRPMLVSGATLALCNILLVNTGNIAAFVLLAVAASVLFLYFVKPLNLRDIIIIPAICVSLAVGSVSFLIYNAVKIEPLTKYTEATADIAGKITSIPIVSGNYTTFTVKTDKIGDDTVKTYVSITVYTNSSATPEPFDYLFLKNAEISLPSDDYNKTDVSALSDSTALEADCDSFDILWQCTKTPYYYCLKLRTAVTDRINAFSDGDSAGLLCGMLFGDTNNISDNTLSDFRTSGIAHLLAVSGLHTSLWCGLLIALAKLFKIGEKTRNTVCLIFLCGFCVISAFTPSVMRASLMTGVALLAPFFKRRPDALNSLGIAVSVLLIINPYIILSVGFQLSAMSTLGVLLSSQTQYKIHTLANSVKNRFLSKLVSFLLENICISAFAGLFTFPVSAAYFGVFCLVSPLTNILCVQLAFWGMIAGVISCCVSLVPIRAVRTATFFLFDITEFILKAVTNTADFTASLKFANIPVHTQTLIAILSITAVFGIIIYRRNKRATFKTHTKVLVIICVAVDIVCIALPCIPRFSTQITVHPAGNGANISLRSGLDYAFFNCGSYDYGVDKTALPRANCEKLEFLYIAAYSGDSDKVTEILSSYSPENTVITEYVNTHFKESNIAYPPNTLISNYLNFAFNKSINIEIIDTYGVNCVIMETTNKKVMISYGYNNINAAFDTFGVPDILIISQTVPETLPQNVETLIISGSADTVIGENTTNLKTQCKTFITTAENGTVTITL